MADIFKPEKRSEIMSNIRAHGSKPEERLYRLVRVILGHRWRIDRNVETLPGRPDVVVPSLRLILLADGCFFHMCPKHGRIPDTNTQYWKPKLERNVERDRQNREALRRRGYAVWRVWEHDLRGTRLERIERLLEWALPRRVNQVRR